MKYAQLLSMFFYMNSNYVMLIIVCSGGAGGKGTWGKLTDMYDESGHLHDSRDPNYDSAEEEVRGTVLTAFEKERERERVLRQTFC